MKNRIFIALITLVLGCQEVDLPPAPPDLIAQDKMVAIMTDIAILNAAKGYNKRQFEQTGIVPEQYLYDRHGIDSTQLRSSSDYYTARVDLYNEILLQVEHNIMKMGEEINAQLDDLQKEDPDDKQFYINENGERVEKKFSLPNKERTGDTLLRNTGIKLVPAPDRDRTRDTTKKPRLRLTPAPAGTPDTDSR